MAKSNIQIKIEEVDISKIKPNPNNPRIIKDEKFNKLVESIKSFPDMLHIRHGKPFNINNQKPN